jgi:hypothetical protein
MTVTSGRHNVSKKWRNRRSSARVTKEQILNQISLSNLRIDYSAPQEVRDQGIHNDLLGGVTKNALYKLETLQMINTNKYLSEQIKKEEV